MATLSLDKHFLQRRGTTAAIANYAGAQGELVVDTTKNTVVLVSGNAGTNYPLAREDRAITAGSGVALTVGGSAVASTTLAQDFTFAVKASDLVAANDLLTTDANGKLKGAFSLQYTAATGVFSVLGSDGATVLQSVTIPSHLSVLKAVTLETASASTPVNSQTEGTYLHFVFTLSDGTDTDTYVNVTSLIDVYAAGNGLALTGKTFSVTPGDGIKVDASGVAVNLATTGDGAGILKVNPDGTLTVDTSELNTATSTTIVSADTGNIITASSNDGGALLKVSTASDNALETDANGALYVTLDCGVIS